VSILCLRVVASVEEESLSLLQVNHVDASTGVASRGCDEVNVVPLAQMSSLVYQLHSSTTISGSSPEIDAAGFTLAKVKQQPDFEVGGDFLPAFAIWKRTSPCKQAVLAIKGTSGVWSLTDLRVDMKSIIGGEKPETAMAMLQKQVERLQNKGYTVLVTGHSLGGYMGEVMSTTYNLAGAVFDAPGPDSDGNEHNGPHQNAAFQNINAEHDTFGNFMPGVNKHKQWSVYADGLNTHSIDAMITFLKDKSAALSADITNANVLDYCLSKWYGYLL